MTSYSIESISEYIVETTEALYEWDLDNVAMEQELPELHRVIEFLMKETFEAEDPDKKSVLALLEMQARKCRECCLRRTGIRN